MLFDCGRPALTIGLGPRNLGPEPNWWSVLRHRAGQIVRKEKSSHPLWGLIARRSHLRKAGVQIAPVDVLHVYGTGRQGQLIHVNVVL